MYTVYIFIALAALVAAAGTALFALAAIIVAIRAGVEVLADATAASVRKLANSALHRPKIPAIRTVPYEPTFRR